MRILERTYDLAVIGGGAAGFAAATTAANAGLNTILVERRPALGWEGTWAFALEAGEPSGEVCRQVFERVAAAGGRRQDRLDAPILEICLDRLATQAGVTVLYYATPVAMRHADGLLHAVVFGSKTGEFALTARTFVDATENGYLWREAGHSLAPPEETEARQTLFLNGAERTWTESQVLGVCNEVGGVVLYPGVWEGEVAVEFEVSRCDIRSARLLIPQVLEGVREAVPELTPALCTHVGYEPMPVDSWVQEAAEPASESACANLFAAGPWAGAQLSSSVLAQRFAAGEAAGELAVQQLKDFPEIVAPGQGGQSLSSPPLHDTEVLVCGGGTGGALAALAAAREGAETTVLEPATFLGGIGTGGGIHSYYHGVAGGLQDELDQRLAALTPLFQGRGQVQGFHPEAKKVVLEQMADEAGLTVVYDTVVTGVELTDDPTGLPATGAEARRRRLTGVVTAGREGGALYRAQVVVDSTGDGDVAARAGAPYTHGRASDELTHAYSQASGLLGDDCRLRIVNFDAGYCDPTDLEDLTRARRHGLSHYFREHYTAENRLLYLAPLLGLRNSRQILGEYQLTLADEIEGRQFPDVVAYAYSHFDNHGSDYENESDEAAVWVWLLGNWGRRFGCEIPYRCLLPQNLSGVLMACRAISLTHDAHNQLRMQRDMQRLGQVAGVAAALSVRANVAPHELDVAQLQQRLFELGDLGPRRQTALPAEAGDLPQRVHADDWRPELLPAKPVDELVAQLAGEDPRGAVWQLARAGQDSVSALLEAVRGDNSQQRLWSSLVLSLAGREESVPELVACVEQRLDDRSDGRRAAPLWQSAVVLLGRVGSPAAVPALTQVLQDRDASLDALIAAVRALGRIGEEAAASPLEALLDRTDLPTVRELQVSSGALPHPVVEDCRWQLELAVAEALSKVGHPRAELARKYLDDDRAYVRRYARKVLREASADTG